jgi:hypothetical protein
VRRMRVHRPNPQVLVIAERRLSALLGLVVGKVYGNLKHFANPSF